MEIRKNFGKYWVVGIILAFFASAIQYVTSYLGVAANLTVQPAWLVVFFNWCSRSIDFYIC
jgi:hypothetical protein